MFLCYTHILPTHRLLFPSKDGAWRTTALIPVPDKNKPTDDVFRYLTRRHTPVHGCEKKTRIPASPLGVKLPCNQSSGWTNEKASTTSHLIFRDHSEFVLRSSAYKVRRKKERGTRPKGVFHIC